MASGVWRPPLGVTVTASTSAGNVGASAATARVLASDTDQDVTTTTADAVIGDTSLPPKSARETCGRARVPLVP